MPRTVIVVVARVAAETPLALLLQIDDKEYWVPKSLIEDAAEIDIGDEDIEVELADWFARKEGIV